jgi:Alpha-L-arabinofuranosidase B, catalytic
MQSSQRSLRFVLLSSTLPLALSALVACGAPARSGGTSSTGGNSSAGGQTASSNTGAGGASGGAQSSGGATQAGGATSAGGATAAGGVTGLGGSTGAGGSTNRGGATGSGGISGSAGATAAGGAAGSGGAPSSGGVTGSGGTAGGTAPTGAGPCDIYEAAGFPCVGAHSTVRKLYAAYTGPLYQVRKGGSTKDIPVDTDGYVKISEQDSFCSGAQCTISIIYDQSPNKNDLPKTPDTYWLKNANEAFATDGKLTIKGHTAYGIFINNTFTQTRYVGYRNNNCKGVAKNDEAESMYMVLDGKRYSPWCCFDYGNGTNTGNADGPGTMETIYWGTSTQFNKGGSGTGPWVMADLEFGMFACDDPNTACATNTSVSFDYVSAWLKGPSGNAFGLKAGNAQSGKLLVKWNGKRPPGGYTPKKLGGQIILGTGGDGSNTGVGTFWEGAMTKGNPPDSVDDDVQANIVAAGYGK